MYYDTELAQTSPWFDGDLHKPERRGVYAISSRYSATGKPLPCPPESDIPDFFAYWDGRWGRWKLLPEVDMFPAAEQHVWWRGVTEEALKLLTKDMRGDNWRVSYDASHNPRRAWMARWRGINPPSGVGEGITHHTTLEEAVEWLAKKGVAKKALTAALKARMQSIASTP